jgi:hypothetical protein
MNFLPVAHLEMRTAARKPMTYYSRCIIGFVALSTGLGFEIAGFNRALSAASAGQAVFGLLAASGYILLAVQATLLTCDCVSWEKREGTLGLLFLTDLNGFDVVAGKLTAQTSRSFYGLLAALPAFGFCIVLGGVGPLDFMKVTLGLLNTLFYFATLGLLISTCVWHERAAAVWGGLSVLVIGVMLPALGAYAGADALLSIVPAGAMLAALGPALRITPSPPFAAPLLISHVTAWLFAGAAACLLRRSWTSGTRRIPLPQLRSANQSIRATARPRKFKSGNQVLTISMMLATCALGILVGFQVTQKWLVAGATIVLLHWILKFQVISLSSRLLAGRRRSGELEMLLTTPCDEDEIIQTSLSEIKRALLWPTWFALAIDATALIVGWCLLGFVDGMPWVFLVLAETIWMGLNLFSLAWTGLFFGLKMANPAAAAAWTSFWIVLFPWLASAAVAGFTAMLMPNAVHNGDLLGPFALMFVVFIIAGNTAVMGLAIGELRDRFRPIVTETWRPK